MFKKKKNFFSLMKTQIDNYGMWAMYGGLTKSDYKRALNELQNNTKFFSFVEQSVNKSGRNLLKNSVFYNTADVYNYLSIEFKEG